MGSNLRELFEVFPRDVSDLVLLGICANGVLFAQGLNAADAKTGVAEGDLQQQTRACFAKMQQLVEDAGASLENIGRVCCYVSSPDDREPVYALWEKLFPDPGDRPAFKVLTTELPISQQVRFDLIAVRGALRTRVDLQGVEARDPTISIGDWLFTSRLHAISPETGQQVEGLEAQAAQGLANAYGLMGRAGRSEQDVVQVTCFGRDPAYATRARAAIAGRLSEAARSAVLHTLTSWVRPSAEILVEAIALRSAAAEERTDFRELYLCPEHSNQASGFKFGCLVFAPNLMPVDLCSGTPVENGPLEQQLRAVLENMDQLLSVADCGRGDLARVTFFMRDVTARQTLNQIWQEWFPDPDQRPPHTYLPAALPEGYGVAIQVIAVAGGARRILYVPGVQHGDPMSLGGVAGNLLMSSRIFGQASREGADALEEHTATSFANATALLQAGGAGWSDVRQVTAYLSSPDFYSSVEHQLITTNSGPQSAVRLDFRETDLGRRVLLPRLQLLALLDSRQGG
jgi:enamine deaminase RidA (YjgF/YER057c/UK114 family)